MKLEEFYFMLDLQEHFQSNQQVQAQRHFLKAIASHKIINAMLAHLFSSKMQ
jgi:hypothetical protein